MFTVKRKASRHRIPASVRVLSVLEMRPVTSMSDWVFPAATKSGHIETFNRKKLGGHTDLNTTMRYVQLNVEDVRATMEKVQGGHKPGHSPDLPELMA